MTFEEFRGLARRTQNPKLSTEQTRMHALLGIGSEVYENSTAMFASDWMNTVYEAGDVCWMCAELCDTEDIEITSEQILDADPKWLLNSNVFLLQGLYQKAYQGHEVDKAAVRGYVIDILHDVINKTAYRCNWYIRMPEREKLERTLELVLDKNIEKLKERYPDGFDAEKSVHRAVT